MRTEGTSSHLRAKTEVDSTALKQFTGMQKHNHTLDVTAKTVVTAETMLNLHYYSKNEQPIIQR